MVVEVQYHLLSYTFDIDPFVQDEKNEVLHAQFWLTVVSGIPNSAVDYPYT